MSPFFRVRKVFWFIFSRNRDMNAIYHVYLTFRVIFESFGPPEKQDNNVQKSESRKIKATWWKYRILECFFIFFKSLFWAKKSTDLVHQKFHIFRQPMFNKFCKISRLATKWPNSWETRSKWPSQKLLKATNLS